MNTNNRLTLLNRKKVALLLLMLSFLSFSCSDLLDISPPRNELVASSVYTDEATAEAAVINLYHAMINKSFSSGGLGSFSYGAALSSDEYINYNQSDLGDFLRQLNNNELTATNKLIEAYWTDLYASIYNANAIIEGLAASDLTKSTKTRLEGEAFFVRAFHYFYLVNLFGDVPLVLTTDYQTNKQIKRSPSEAVYDQIILDLKKGQDGLPSDYSIFGDLRIRATKGAATALLARTFLYISDWPNAEVEASKLINNTKLYTLESDLTKVFKSKSQEAIFQLYRDQYPMDAQTFNLSGKELTSGVFRSGFIAHFNDNDLRRATWIKETQKDSNPYYYATKYNTGSSPLDLTTLFRLAEQYLIRAEALAHQDRLEESKNDLNAIRRRANFPETASLDREVLLGEIMDERRLELFTEWGHRWLDLKRTQQVDDVLKPVKGSDKWQTTDALYPIPQIQITNDPAMKDAQNPGY